MAEQEFSILYDGPGIADGSIDLRGLSESIRGLSDLYRDAHSELFPEADDVEIRLVRAEPGSIVLFVSIRTIEDTELVRLFASDTTTALANFMGLYLGITGATRFLRKRFASGEVVRTEVIDATTLRHFFADGTYEDFPFTARHLAQRPSFRDALRRVTSVFNPEQVTVIGLRHPIPGEPLILTPEDQATLPNDLYPEVQEISLTDTHVVTLKSVALDGRMWRIGDDGHSRYVKMADNEFQSRIDRRLETFRKGDRLRVKIKLDRYRTPSGDSREERTIVEVLDRPEPQQEIPFE